MKKTFGQVFLGVLFLSLSIQPGFTAQLPQLNSTDSKLIQKLYDRSVFMTHTQGCNRLDFVQFLEQRPGCTGICTAQEKARDTMRMYTHMHECIDDAWS